MSFANRDLQLICTVVWKNMHVIVVLFFLNKWADCVCIYCCSIVVVLGFICGPQKLFSQCCFSRKAQLYLRATTKQWEHYLLLCKERQEELCQWPAARSCISKLSESVSMSVASRPEVGPVCLWNVRWRWCCGLTLCQTLWWCSGPGFVPLHE